MDAAHPEVRAALYLVDREHGGDGFDLQDKLVGDNDIRLEAVTDWCTFISDGNRDLPREDNARLS